MGLLDEFSESPEQEKDRRAAREGKREAREGSSVGNFFHDLVDEFSYGRDYLDRKVATREGEKEGMRGDSSLNNVVNDTHDELCHGSEYVARKQYYREKSGDSPSAEESSYGVGTGSDRDGSHSGYSSGGDYSGGRSGRRYSRKSRRNRRSSQGFSGGGGYSYSPSPGSSSTESPSDPTEGPALVVAGLIVVGLVGLLIWMFSCIATSIQRAAVKPYKPSTLPTAITSGPSGTSFFTGEGDPLAFQAYNDGNYFLKQSEYDQAVSYLTDAIRRAPNYYEAYLSRGAAYDYLGRNDLSLLDYNAAVHLRPSRPQAYLGRGLSEHRSGQQQQAVNDLTQGLRLNPTESRDVYYRARGTAYLMLNQFQRAIEDFNETLHLKPNDSFSMGNRGAARSNLGQYQAALEDYNSAINLSPVDVSLYLGRGVTYEHLGQYHDAIQDYDEAVRLDPNSAQARTFRENAIVRSGYTEADRSLTIPPDDSAVSDTDTPDPSSASNTAQQAKPGFSDCYRGTWRENESNGFFWYFRQLGNNLRISRNDGFVWGDFQPSQDGWSGSLNWGNDTKLDGVTLRANEICNEIRTNQRWWYKR